MNKKASWHLLDPRFLLIISRQYDSRLVIGIHNEKLLCEGNTEKCVS